MQTPVITSKHGVTVVGGGEITRATLLEVLTYAPDVVAADGGAGVLMGFDVTPQAVIGDFDSLDADTRGALDPATLHHIPEQDSTDFEKCITRIDSPLVLAAGFTGKRSDHEMAVYNVLVRQTGLSRRRVVVVGESDVCVHLDAALTLELAVGTRVSLFPLARVQGRSQGLRWPLDGIPFAPDGRIGTSNESNAQQVTIAMEGPGMLLFLPRAALGALLSALRRLDG